MKVPKSGISWPKRTKIWVERGRESGVRYGKKDLAKFLANVQDKNTSTIEYNLLTEF